MTSIPNSSPHAIARERAIELAEREIPVISTFLDSPGWAYFSRRLRDLRDLHTTSLIGDESLSDQTTKTLRFLIKEYDALLDLPSVDRARHVHLLEMNANRPVGPSRG